MRSRFTPHKDENMTRKSINLVNSHYTTLSGCENMEVWGASRLFDLEVVLRHIIVGMEGTRGTSGRV